MRPNEPKLCRTDRQKSVEREADCSLLEYAEGGLFLANFSRRARKRYVRLVTMTQSPELFVRDRQGSVVASNAAIKILKAQDRTSVAAVSQCFGLTRGEQQRLLTLGKQAAMLFAGDRRVILSIQASPQEHALMTTNPVELAQRSIVPDQKHQSQGSVSPSPETAFRMRNVRTRCRGGHKGGSN